MKVELGGSRATERRPPRRGPLDAALGPRGGLRAPDGQTRADPGIRSRSCLPRWLVRACPRTATRATMTIPTQARTEAPTRWKSPIRSGSMPSRPRARRRPTRRGRPRAPGSGAAGRRGRGSGRRPTRAGSRRAGPGPAPVRGSRHGRRSVPGAVPRVMLGPAARSWIGSRDPAATEADLAVVEHGGLAGRDRPDRLVGLDDPSPAARRLAVRRRADRRRDGRGAVADPDRRPELPRPAAASSMNPTSSIVNVVVSRSSRRPRVIVFVDRIHARDVARHPQSEPQALALAGREPGGAVVLPDPPAVGIEDADPARASSPRASQRARTSPSGMKQIPWLSGLSAVARPRRRATRADLRASSARRAGTARRAAGPGGGRTGSTSGPCPRRGRRARRARPSAVTTRRA